MPEIDYEREYEGDAKIERQTLNNWNDLSAKDFKTPFMGNDYDITYESLTETLFEESDGDIQRNLFTKAIDLLGEAHLSDGTLTDSDMEQLRECLLRFGMIAAKNSINYFLKCGDMVTPEGCDCNEFSISSKMLTKLLNED